MPDNFEPKFAGQKSKRFFKKDKRDKNVDLVDRQPPFNLEAEVGVLGSIMLNPDTCDDIVNILRPVDFYDEAHQVIFRHIMELHGGGKKIDPLLIRESLIGQNELELIGGAGRLAEIFSAVSHPAHVSFYANIVRSKATARNLIVTCSELLNDDTADDAFERCVTVVIPA